MATNQTGIYITVKAWLPTGKGLDEMFTALSLVKSAHETGDYAPLLSAAKIEAVQTEQKTRRMEEPSVGQQIIEAMAEVLESATDQPTPAAADPAIVEAPVLDQADGVDERPANPDLGLTEEAPAKRKGKAA